MKDKEKKEKETKETKEKKEETEAKETKMKGRPILRKKKYTYTQTGLINRGSVTVYAYVHFFFRRGFAPRILIFFQGKESRRF